VPKDRDDVTGTETTGHEWDGIRELDTPLPRWWSYIFYACIAFALIYWVLYPAWPWINGYSKGVLGWSRHAELAAEMASAQADRDVFVDRIEAASVEQIAGDRELLQFTLAGGRSAFALNCSQCHGGGAQGGFGYPNLGDDAWIWGGTLADIETTIRYGIRSDHEDTRLMEMPAFGTDELLEPVQIDDAAEYVLSFTGRETDTAAADRGSVIFADECGYCHGESGEGMAELGAPRVNDHIWIYDGDKAALVETISTSRGGVMPFWEGRLDDATIKQLAVYVHSLGGGE
jgi:cytochrome c oxidase cbb3-type subunit III